MTGSDEEDEIPELVEFPSDDGQQKIIPITILSGFLGSGKTTLLNKILTGCHGLKIAVIENEFSEGLGIEGMIAKSGVNGDNISNFFELSNGCICCTVKDSLLSTLEQLVLHKDKFDYIVIETTGMANPGPIISSFWTDDNLGSCLRIDGVICVVDCANIMGYLVSEDIAYEVRQQISYADRILMNKSDLISEDQYLQALEAVKSINRFAVYGKSSFGQIPLDFVLAINSYSAAQVNLQSLYSATQEKHQAVFCYPCEPGSNSLSLQSPLPASHVKNAVSSAAFRFREAFDVKTLKAKLDYIIYERNIQDAAVMQTEKEKSSMKIYRMKGIFHCTEPSTHLYVLQAVHNLFDLQLTDYLVESSQDKTNGESLLVVIGSNLDPSFIEAELRMALQSK